MPEALLYPRFAEAGLMEALDDSPVVLLHGPRQCGKTTLARLVGEGRGYTYLTFDDDVSRAPADSDPRGFVDGLPDRVILDEIQRVPAIFTAIKAAVDRARVPGRFLLTGSANVLLVPALADSPAGRMDTLRLFPLAQAEISRTASGFISALFEPAFRDRDDFEVDIVIERGARRLAGVEVKASATVREGDFRGLRKLRDAAGARFRCGVVLYDGELTTAFGDRLYAVPVRALWETAA